MSKRALGGLLGMVLALALVATPLWADSEVRIVRLSLVDGPVQLDRGTGEGFERAIMNMPITNGMRLWTRDDSRAEVEFEDGTSLRLTPGTKVEFSRLALTDNGRRETVVTIESGEAYVTYRNKNHEDFHIRAGDRELDLTKAVELRINVDPERADIAVLGGELIADGAKVKKNHTAVLTFASGGYEVADGVLPGADDGWNKDRNDFLSRYQTASYGYSSLNYYGSWFDSPYGSCWRPYGFSAAWSPYSSGAWVLYPNYGYSWVSLYPWGWQPYRSGFWNYAGSGIGYCWTPGPRFYGLGYAPVYHAPSGYVPPQPPPTKPPVVPPPHKGPWPPTSIVSGGPKIHGSPDARLPGTILPVGDVDAQTWSPRHNPGRPAWHDSQQNGFTSMNGKTTGGSNTNMPNNGRVNVPQGNRWSPADRSAWRNQQRQAQPEQRSGERASPSPSHMSAPAPAPAPRMSAPAPRMEAPRSEAPRSSGSSSSSRTPHQ